MKRYFITGTDTGSGKTYVTCRLLDYMHQNNQKAIAVKPIASGLTVMDGESCFEDLVALHRHNRSVVSEICPWRFERPVSPHLAAQYENRYVSAQQIAAFCQGDQVPDADYLFIEGAGGLMVPLNEQETWLDVLRLSGIPVILVVGMRLGCLNHAMLTGQVLSMHELPWVGWIANCLDEQMLLLKDNIETLKHRLQAPLLGILPYQGAFETHYSTEVIVNIESKK